MAQNFKTYLADGKFIWLIPVFFGMVGIDYGIYIQVKERNAREWSTTVGILEESKVAVSQSSEGKPTYQPMVRYPYTVNGKSYVGTKLFLGIAVGIGSRKTIEKQLKPYYRGMRVKVFYNPRDPEEACLDLDGPAKYFGFATGFFALSVGLLAFTNVRKVLSGDPFQKWFNAMLWSGLGVSIYLGACLYRGYLLNEWLVTLMPMVSGFSIGGGSFYLSYLLLKFKRRMENVPTSKIATGAVGSNVEIVGKVSDDSMSTFTAPISQTPCSFYFLKIEERSQDEENAWVTLFEFGPRPWFCVEDDSEGLALVVHEEAELHLRWTDSTMSRKDRFNEAIQTFRSHLKAEKTYREIGAMGWLSASKVYRISECVIQPDDKVYVFGYARSGADFFGGYQTFRDPGEGQAVRKMADGSIDDHEITPVAEATTLPQEFSWPTGNLVSLGHRIKMVFQKVGERQGPFVVSNRSEKGLAKVFHRETQFYLACGGALIFSHFLGLIMLVF